MAIPATPSLRDLRRNPGPYGNSTLNRLAEQRESTFANLRGGGSAFGGPDNIARSINSVYDDLRGLEPDPGQLDPTATPFSPSTPLTSTGAVPSSTSRLPLQDFKGLVVPETAFTTPGMSPVGMAAFSAVQMAQMNAQKALIEQRLRDMGVGTQTEGRDPNRVAEDLAIIERETNRVLAPASAQAGAPSSSPGLPKGVRVTAYSGESGKPTATGAAALAAGGRPITGVGGTQITGMPGNAFATPSFPTTSTPSSGFEPGAGFSGGMSAPANFDSLPIYKQNQYPVGQRGGNRFTLTQGSASSVTPIAGPAAAPTSPGITAAPATPTPSGPGTPLQQAGAAFQSPQKAMAAAFAPGVTDHIGAFLAAGGQPDNQTIRTLNDVMLKREAAAAKGRNDAALKSAYTDETTVPTDAASAPAKGAKPTGATAGVQGSPDATTDAPDPVADAETEVATAQAHLSNAVGAGLTNDSVINKLSTNVQNARKKVEAAKAHKMVLEQINTQNDSLMGFIDEAEKLADKAGPIAAMGVGKPGFSGVSQLHTLVQSMKANEMMDYVQRMKSASTTGSTGLGRILQVEADAMSKTLAALGDEKVPLEAQQPDFVRKQLQQLKYQSTRLNLASNGIDPASRTFPNDAAADKAGAAGKLKDGDRVIINKIPAIWKK